MYDIDTTYTSPDERIASPSGDYIKLRLPFVGIYNSRLDADIENDIEREMDGREDNGEEPWKKAVVDLKAIYRDIAEYTARLLGFKSATYAGANSPSYYNYRDDYIFVWVKRSELEELCAKYGLDADSEDDNEKLFIALAADNDKLIVEKSEYPLYAVALAVYDEWYDSDGQWGYETIANSVEYS